MSEMLSLEVTLLTQPNKRICYLNPLPGHGEQADVVLGVASGLVIADDVNGFMLGGQSRRQEVPIAHEVAVVHANERAFQHHVRLSRAAGGDLILSR